MTRVPIRAAGLILLAYSASAQQAGDKFPVAPPPSGPAPRTADGKPDLSGVWLGPKTVQRGTPDMLPSAALIFKQRVENNLRDMPSSRCLPMGIGLLTPLVNKFIQTPELLVALREVDASFQQVFLNRADHPKDLEPSWTGHSIGRWQGDTLVVETVGFNDKSWIDGAGHPRTEKLRVVQELHRPDLGHLEIQTTIYDEGAYTQPWTFKQVSDLAPAEEIREFICAENNIDVEHLVGK